MCKKVEKTGKENEKGRKQLRKVQQKWRKLGRSGKQMK